MFAGISGRHQPCALRPGLRPHRLLQGENRPWNDRRVAVHLPVADPEVHRSGPYIWVPRREVIEVFELVGGAITSSTENRFEDL